MSEEHQEPTGSMDLTLSAMYKAISDRIVALPEDEQKKIHDIRQALRGVMKDTGDAGKVAYVLFQLEFDLGALPYGDHFNDVPEIR
jgi:hypothetical protein